MKVGALMSRLFGKSLLLEGHSAKVDTVLRDNAPRAESAPVIVVQPAHINLIAISSAPETRPFMPAITIKTTLPRAAGVIGIRRQGPLRRSTRTREEIRQARFRRKGRRREAALRRQALCRQALRDKSDGAKSYGKKPYSGSGKPYAGKREGPPPRRDGDARAVIMLTQGFSPA